MSTFFSNYGTWFSTLLMLLFFSISAIGQSTCSETLTATGDDSDPTEVVFSSFPCTGGGTVTGLELTTTSTDSYCPSWYEYTIEVVHGGGTETMTGQCNVTNLDLASFNTATINVASISSVKITSVDADAYSDNVTIDATLNVTYTPPPCPMPTSLDVDNIATTSAELDWTPGGSETQWDIEWGAAGFTPGAGTTISAVTASFYALSGLSSNTAYEFYVRADCGGSGTSFWAGPFFFRTAANALTLPYGNDFETNLTDFYHHPLSTDLWVIDTAASSGNSSIKNSYGSNAASQLILPNPIDLSTYPNAVLTFDHIAKLEGGYDEGRVLYSTNGTEWYALPPSNYLSGSSNYAADTLFDEDSYTDWGTTNTTPTNAWWKTETFSLAGLAPDTIYISFILFSDGSAQREGWYIDNLTITNPACSQPTALGATNITSTSADLFWTTGGAFDWNVEYGPLGFTPGTGTLLNASDDTLNISSLSPNTAYEYYVRDSCGVGNVSVYNGPFSFTTLCAPVTSFPWLEDFETSQSSIPSCWENATGDDADWQFMDGSIGHGATTDNTTGTSSGYYAGMDDSHSSANDTINNLLTPSFDLTSLTNPRLNFHYFIGNDATLTSTIIIDVYDGSVWHDNVSTVTFTQAAWLQHTVDLTPYISSNTRIRFRGIETTDYNSDVSIDDVIVEELPSCLAPSGITASNLTSNTADIAWTTGGATDWQIQYGLEGFTPGTGTWTAANTNPHTLTGLSANKTYDVYVRDSCAAGDVSAWAGPVTLTTLCAGPMSGTYTIDASQPSSTTNFTSFSQAADELNACGVSGAVVINVAPGTYTDSLALMDITGASAVNTVTFDGGDASLAEITYSSNDDHPTIYFNGADHVTIQNLTVSNNSSSDGWGILFQNSSDSNTIDSCHVVMPIGSTTDIIGIVASNSLSFETSTGDNANYLTVSNCSITGGESGIHLEGESSDTDYNVGNSILNNTFRHHDDHGIQVDGQLDLTVIGNDIDSLINTGADGIYLSNVNNFSVRSNKVIAPDYGIYVNDGNDGFAATNNSTVINNMIISTTDYGLYLNDFENTDVFHNTVVGEPAMRINDQINLDARNNIFVSTGDYAFESTDALDPTDVVDYNLYYSQSSNAFDIGTSTYTDLAAWQSAEPSYNSNSLEGDPLFVSTTDLHMLGPLANDVADATVGVTVDIDGDPRSASSPDIGADEYTPASCIPSSGLTATMIGPDSAVVSWHAGGGTSFDLEYGPAGFAQGTGNTVTVTDTFYVITGLSAATGYEFYVQDDCGSSTSIWSVAGSFNTWFNAPAPLNCTSGSPNTVFVEEFDDNSAGWTGDINSGNDTWEIPDGASSSNTGADAAHSGSSYMNFEASNTSVSSGEIVSPAIDLSNGADDAELSFWMHAYGADMGTLTVGVATSASGPFVPLVTWSGQLQTSGSDPWVNVGADLSPYVGQVIYLQFHQLDDGTTYTGDMSIDLVEVMTCSSPSGCSPFTSNIVNDSICAPGNTSFTASTGSYVTFFNGAGNVRFSDDTLSFFTAVDTTVSLHEATPSGITGHVGPMPGIASSGFGNFTNGQYITVMDSIRIDSMTVRANGPVTAQVVISADDSGNSELQRGEVFTTGSATGDYQVEVGTVLTPGTYFMNVDFISGSGQLFRATSGASYPYDLPGLLSIDSTNFSDQSRLYYTFDLVVSEMCLGSPVNVTSYIVGLSAGADATLALCDDASAVDLSGYLSANASTGGTFSSTSASAGLTGSILDPALLSAGNYSVIYAVPAQGGCPADTALIDVTIEACASCASLTPPTLVGDTTCGPGTVNITAGTSATDVAWYNDNNDIIRYGTGVWSPSIATNTSFTAAAVLSSGPRITVGPSVEAFSNPYPTGNFTNGQYITAHQTVRIDSATFAVNGALDFVVAIHDIDRTDTLQTSKLVSFSGADTAQKEVGIVLTPGTYFINTIPVSGSGILYRPTGGANFPYGANNLLTADSSDFGPTRYYYLNEMIVSGACISATDSVLGVVETQPMAGNDTVAVVCTNNNNVDLSAYLSGADAGGAWLDDDTTGAVTGSTFDATQVSGNASYAFSYVVSNGPCTDSATISLFVEFPADAGADATDTICDTAAVVDLNSYLSANATPGGSWVDVDATGALTDSLFDPIAVSSGQTYNFRYLATSNCGIDSAMVSIFIEDCDVSLSEYGGLGVSVFPNPTKGSFFVEHEQGNTKVTIEVYSTSGQLVMKQKSNARKTEIDLSGFADGIYNVKVTHSNGVEVHRLAKH